ncbi:MAG TPA: NADH-quinone oxidoreductase subunit L [Anaeromyxobacteraceae bacterium]|nr:NADH-quinone oxidoreductase subunit L [Anaeromyxobacteraceae bacterium]
MEHATHSLGPILFEQARYLWLVPLLPLLGAALNLCFGRAFERAGRKALVHVVGVGAVALAFLVALFAFVEMLQLPAERRFLQDTLWNLFSAGRVTVDLAFALDPLSMMMVLIVTFIGALIHVFSIGYMWNDEAKAYWRFFAWLNLFIFSMLLLVMGDNFVLMFFGWEGVGLCSYGLIAFYYTDREKAAAGMKAFVVNRFGDFGFVVGLLLLFWGLGGAWASSGQARGPRYEPAPGLASMAAASSAAEALKLAPTVEVGGGEAKPTSGEGSSGRVKLGPTLNFRELRDEVVIEETGIAQHLRDEKVFGFALLALIGICLFVGAMGKSAQLPLYVWLPDAMAGPTPVSALIHAATMVTAGVYMVARLNFIFALSPAAMAWVAFVGALTALFAASIGFFQYDIKKVLAYSTVSQLGFMFIGVGVGAYWAGAYHLLTHAFFKATLFLGSGSVILGCHHEQDMRKMGGLKQYMPITRRTYLWACFAIAGFPWASGFYSKDEILWKAFSSGHLALFGVPTPWLGPAIYLAGILAATGTSFYMFRSYYMTFTGPYRGGQGHGHEHGEDPHASVAAPHHAEASGYHDAHPAPDTAHLAGHGAAQHGSHRPVESPRSITAVLVVLAAGAVLSGLLGLPKVWTGHEPLLERWLSPALTSEIPFLEKAPSLEFVFQGLGILAGAVGWFFAMLLYKDGRSTVPARLKARFLSAWTVVYNKYYVDELYGLTVVRGSLALARLCALFDGHVIDALVNLCATIGRGFAGIDDFIDRWFVDGAVNAVAALTVDGGRALRRVQTGRIQTYLYGALAGGLAVILLNFLIR